MPNSIPPDLHKIRSSQTNWLSFHYFLKLSKWTDQGGVEPPFFVVHTVYALRLSHTACTGNASPIRQLVLLTHCEPIRFPGLPTFDWWQLMTSDSTITKKRLASLWVFDPSPLLLWGFGFFQCQWFLLIVCVPWHSAGLGHVLPFDAGCNPFAWDIWWTLRSDTAAWILSLLQRMWFWSLVLKSRFRTIRCPKYSMNPISFQMDNLN